jgi:hypothetical protein
MDVVCWRKKDDEMIGCRSLDLIQMEYAVIVVCLTLIRTLKMIMISACVCHYCCTGERALYRLNC